jgi:hypothetical protein
MACAAALAAAGVAYGAPFNNEIDVGIFGLVSGDYGVHYERNLNDYFALGGGAGYSPRSYLWLDFGDLLDDMRWRYGHVKADGKLYPLGKFKGLYIQAEVNADFITLEDKNDGTTAHYTNVWPGALVGWRWVVAERATISVAGGSGYNTRTEYVVGDVTLTTDTEIRPRLDFNLGFLF